MTTPNSTTERGVTDAEVDTYCDAWGASFKAENPFHTVSCGPADRAHIKAGLEAFAQSRLASAQGGEVPAPLAACPITGRKFWGNIHHPELGMVATYGGPLDTYTVPAISEDGELRSERYDQDAGRWVEGGEPVGWLYDEQQGDGGESQYQHDRLTRRLEVAGYELQRERFKAEQFFKILVGIFNLLNPEVVQLEDGRAMRFNNPHANETLDALSKRIRAIKADIEAVATPPNAPQDGLVGDAERLTPDEVEVLLQLLGEHDGSDFEPECPNCTAYRKLAAIRAGRKG